MIRIVEQKLSYILLSNQYRGILAKVLNKYSKNCLIYLKRVIKANLINPILNFATIKCFIQFHVLNKISYH